MNKNAKAWVEALESGKFKQTRGKLTKISTRGLLSYCCLGVACELYRQAHIKTIIDDKKHIGVRAYDGELNMLPERVQKWLGIRTNNGAYVTDKGIGDLIDDNDSRCLSFKKIAAIIRLEPKGLFVKQVRRKK